MDIDVDLRLAWLFTRELTVQSRLALRAFDDLVRLGGYPAPLMDPRADLNLEKLSSEFNRVFREAESKREPAFLLVHSFLAHVSNVSKILWPPNPRNSPFNRETRKERAEALRRILGVPKTSVLEARDFRDALEHFDERLETWFQSEDGQSLDLWDMNQFPFGLAGLRTPTSETASLRILKWQPIRFAFLGSEVDLEAMADALVLLHDAALLWQTQAASAGVSRQITQREPVQMYLQRPDSDSKAQQQFDDACDFLRDLGIFHVWTDATLNEMSAFVESRGWRWSGEQASALDGRPGARIVKPLEMTTYIAPGRSVQEGLTVALAWLLREELRESQRPSILRVNASGSWSLIAVNTI